jgi:Fic family protein
MNPRIGKKIVQSVAGESYTAYIPPKLPPIPPLDLVALYPYLEKATLALGELNSIHKLIPNKTLFIYMYIRKEALLSSQIEGTQSSFSDLMLFEHNQKPEVSLDDVEEVSNYIKAIIHGLNRLKEGFPLSLRMIREIHGVLLSGGRGSSQLPGEFRRSQNWIGGTRPGNALFVPPSIDHLDQCLFDLEEFMHDESLPILIKAGLIHVQFETIHPFLDGNGRLGRLLIALLLCQGGILDEPILYLSLYLKQNRDIYYNLLQEVRSNGTWETWLEFFLKGVNQCAKQAISTANSINNLFDQDQIKIQTLGRARFSCEHILNYMKRLPQINVSIIMNALNMTAPTARNSLNHMVKIGILEEISGKKRDKIYVYRNYLDILEEGSEPFSMNNKS